MDTNLTTIILIIAMTIYPMWKGKAATNITMKMVGNLDGRHKTSYLQINTT